MSVVGSKTCHRLSNFWNFFGRRGPNDFLSRLLTMDETWLYHYDPETKQQSVEWWHSDSPHPKKFPVQKSIGKVFALIFLGSRWHPPHWFSSKRPNYQCGVLLISAGATEVHLERKALREGHQGNLVLARQCTGTLVTCNPEETGLFGLPVSISPILFSGSGPVGLPPVPWTDKTTEMSPFFFRRGGHCCHGDLVGRTTSRFFFSSL